MDTAEIFGKIIEKHGSLNIHAKEEIRRIRTFIIEDEGTKLHTDLALLHYEYDYPAFDLNDERAFLDYKSRLQLTAEEIIAYAIPFKYKAIIQKDIKTIQAAQGAEKQVMAIDMLLQHARVLYSNKKALTKEHVTITDSITYFDNKVFYNGELATNPRLDSQERAIWKLLSECREHPKHVTFKQLFEIVDSKSRKLFTRLDDSITSDIAKWNKDFKKFRVKILRKDGERIVLDEQPIRYKK